MLLNIEKSGEQDQEHSEEWLVNIDPDCNVLNSFFNSSLTNPLVSCADRTKLDLALFNNSNNGGRAPDFTNNIAISSKRNNVHLEQTIKGQAASDLYEIEKLVDQLKRLVVDTQDEEDQK